MGTKQKVDRNEKEGTQDECSQGIALRTSASGSDWMADLHMSTVLTLLWQRNFRRNAGPRAAKIWRKPRRENFEEHKKKVLQFGEWWKIERTKSSA